MSSGIAGSLLRRVNGTDFEDRGSWKTASDVPREISEGFKIPDGKTSFWDEGIAEETRTDAVMSLVLQRSSIGKLYLAALLQNSLPFNISKRITRTPGDTPYKPGIDLHYELQDPVENDYPELALAVARRNKFPILTIQEQHDLIEDAYMAQKFCVEDREIEPPLVLDIKKLLGRRLISAADLARDASSTIIDLREQTNGRSIPRSLRLPSNDLPGELARRKIGRSADLALYCDNGARSRDYARQLRIVGFKFVRVLIGGYAAWIAADLPLEV